MSRTFAYVRVSKMQQDTENQIREIALAGFTIAPHRIITETVSGSIPIAQRQGFAHLLNKMENGDVLVVTKLDRLGRDAIDVSITVNKLEQMGIKIHCLTLGGVDLTSSAGKMTMGVINAVAQFERDLLIERTQSGLARAKANGKTLGRPQILAELQKKQVIQQLQEGKTITSIARHFNTSRQTIMRIRDNNL
ncbi:recombinase family protein [Candidatus Rickettsia colombianensi]|uniref:recombinase family protein n=1 Tax=Candidatus Rickettsia colombianensi TaxID=1090944 RepID=UPI000EF18B62|nr:recombinase family protein [Candidatus Rickettsia colombianensi]